MKKNNNPAAIAAPIIPPIRDQGTAAAAGVGVGVDVGVGVGAGVGAGVTVTTNQPVVPCRVAVISAVPALTPLTKPVSLTVAIPA